MDMQKYEDATSDEYTLQHLAESKENLKSFITNRLEESHPRDDYRAPGFDLSWRCSSKWSKIYGTWGDAPSQMDGKVIYTFKVWIF